MGGLNISVILLASLLLVKYPKNLIEYCHN